MKPGGWRATPEQRARMSAAQRNRPCRPINLCSFSGCDFRVVSFGLCGGHRAQRDRGEVVRPLRRHQTPLDRIASSCVITESGCFEYIKSKRGRTGYGQVSVKSSMKPAHRVAWQEVNGPIPPGMVIMHKCDNPPCVNIGHLALGTVADNNRDRDQKGRAAVGERAGRARLTAADVLQVRELYSSGIRKADIARNYGVSFGAIASILRGDTWRHV